MLKYLIPVLGIFLIQCSSSTTESAIQNTASHPLQLENGIWRFALQLDNAELPFTVELKDIYSNNPSAILRNNDEQIEIIDITISRDSIRLSLPVFPSILEGKIESSNLISGVWRNLSKENYTIPFVAEHNKDFRFTSTKSSIEIYNTYKVQFDIDTENPYDAVLKLKNKQGKISGTFLTETGDYRYLEGNLMNGGIYLSTFDGSHAFYFSADIRGDSLINGQFNSGTHYTSRWNAIADSTFTLRRPEELTYLNPGYSKLDFSLPNQDGDTVSWNNLNLDNKVVIVDIMGSWCPNCMDANKALKSLTSQYSTSQIEVLTIAFELTDDIELARERLSKMNKDLGNPLNKFLFAGYAKKSRAKEIFPMLNHIMSFPTLIFIDKSQDIRQIYTGFYGPGTGKHYDDFMKNTAILLDEMVSEQI